jgi:hypothetical protein
MCSPPTPRQAARDLLFVHKVKIELARGTAVVITGDDASMCVRACVCAFMSTSYTVHHDVFLSFCSCHSEVDEELVAADGDAASA